MVLFVRWIGVPAVALLGWVVGGCAGPGAGGRMVTIHPGETRVPAGARALIHGLSGCYRAALRISPRLAGELKLTAEFGEEGGLKTFSTESELPSKLNDCIRDRIARWRLSPTTGRRVVGPLKVSFQPVPEALAHQRSPHRRPSRRPGFANTLVWPESMPSATTGGDSTVGGRIRKLIRERVANLRYCYNRELIGQPAYRASARVSFTINPYGLPYLVRVKPAAPGSLNQRMVSCLKQKVVEWHFFRLPVDVRYGPFVIRFARRR